MDIKTHFSKSIEVKQKILDDAGLLSVITEVAGIAVASLSAGGRILLCGNGGSAADAQHIAAELSGRYGFDRAPLDAEALHVNSSYLTAVANDYAFDEVYARLVRAKGRKGDLLIAISTSGNSENIIRAMNAANAIGMITIAMTGQNGGKLKTACALLVNVPSEITPIIQEAHIAIGHVICGLIEEKMFKK
ncbi:MAG: SIS domain-containing protein [Bacteroidota bacterium]